MRRNTQLTLGAMLITFLIALACGGGDPLESAVIGTDKEGNPGPTFVAHYSVVVLDPEEPVVATRVVLSQPEVTANPGQPVILSATAYDAAGLPVTGVQLQWRMRDPNAGSVNNVGFLLGGLIPGVYPGALEVIVTQEVNGETVTLVIQTTVKIVLSLGQRLLSFVGVYPSTVTVRPGQFIGLGALGWDGQGRFIPGLQFDWSMEDPKAGSIDVFGFFTAGGTPADYPNAIRVRAIHTTSQDTILRENFVSVTIGEGAPPGIVESVEIVPSSVFLEPGDEVQFFAFAFDGNSQPVKDVDFLWSVESPASSNIDHLGKLTANAEFGHYPGAVRVTAIQALPEGEVRIEDSANVTVMQPESQRKLAGTSIVPSSVALDSGQRFLFTAIAFDENGTETPGVSYSWEVVDPRAGSIDELGVFTAGDVAGTFSDALRITAIQGSGKDQRSATSYASVGIIGDLEKITVRPAPVFVRPGQSVLLQVTGHDANDLPVFPLRSKWGMENPKAGSIDSAGVFTAGNQPGEYVNAIRVEVRE